MNLTEFIESPLRNLWIKDSGLNYYVWKHPLMNGLIVLANCGVDPSSSVQFGMWRFLKRYSSTVPFMMEQVLNPHLARYVERCGWTRFMRSGVPQFYSPLAMEKYQIRVLCDGSEDITLRLWEEDLKYWPE